MIYHIFSLHGHQVQTELNARYVILCVLIVLTALHLLNRMFVLKDTKQYIRFNILADATLVTAFTIIFML
jgi:hypothetical protein